MAFRNIALFGAGGTTIGAYVLEALVHDGTFHTTAVARQSSKTQFPASVEVVRVADDLPYDELVKAFKDQDVVICATGLEAHSAHYKLIDAAIDAGVRRFIPSEWGMDNSDVNNQELCPIFNGKAEVETYLRSKQSSAFTWTAVATSIWLEWAFDTKAVGVDIVDHAVQYWAGGMQRFSNTTLPYAAQGTLQVLKYPSLAVNQRIFFSAFEASQQDIVAELEKQQGVKYDCSEVDGYRIVRESQTGWKNERDVLFAYQLVSAGLLLPGFGSDFRTAGKQPLLEDLVDMPKLTLEDVVREVLGTSGLNGTVKS